MRPDARDRPSGLRACRKTPATVIATAGKKAGRSELPIFNDRQAVEVSRTPENRQEITFNEFSADQPERRPSSASTADKKGTPQRPIQFQCLISASR
jgi:hypothetical protein